MTDQKPGIEPRVWAKWLAWGVLSWALVATLIWLGFAVARALEVPDGPPPYGYDCDSAYRLAEANCPQDR